MGSTELAGVGHMTPMEAPEAVTARIRELVTAYARPAGRTGGADGIDGIDAIKEGA